MIIINTFTQSSTTPEDHGVTSGDDALNGVFISSEEIDMDVAASMMAALNPPSGEVVPSNEEEEILDGGGGHHHRQRGVIAGETSCNGNGASFGTIVNMHTSTGEYLYADPLGGCKSFDETETDTDPDAENDFVSDPYRPDHHHHHDHEESNRLSSTSDDDVDNVPVLDLFTGNFADFETLPAEPDHSTHDDSDGGWANFDHFDDGGDGSNTGDTHRMVMVGSDAVGSEMNTERVIMEGTEVAKAKR